MIRDKNYQNWNQIIAWNIWIYGDRNFLYIAISSDSSKPHPEKKTIDEYFCCGNTLLLPIKWENLGLGFMAYQQLLVI